MPKNNLLIGRYTTVTYENDADSTNTKSVEIGLPVYTDYVIRINILTGNIVSNNKLNIRNGVYATTYYYNESEKTYILYRSDNYLISIDPSTGEIIKELYVGKILVSSVYNAINNTLISLGFPASDSQQIYLLVINSETGAEVTRNAIESGNGYYANIAGYDKENNWYITVNSKFEVVCFDISTGEIKKTYKLENPLFDIKFWRR